MLRHIKYAVLILLLYTSASVTAAEATIVTATVTADKPELVKGLPVRVLQKQDGRGGWVRINEKESYAFDDAGSLPIDLPAGVYVFEVLHNAEDNTMFAVQSAPTDIARGKPVTIMVPDPQPVTLTHDKLAMEVDQVAVRSAAVRGEVRWKRVTLQEKTPRLAISPKSTSLVNVIGSNGGTHVAAWVRADPRTGTAFVTRPEWNSVQFVWLPKSPAAKSVIAHLGSPDTKTDIPVTPQTRLITNRKFWMIGYTAEFPTGPTVKFRSVGRNISRAEKHEFGGPELTPHAWAQNLCHDSGSFHFTWRYALLDSAGRMVEVDDDSGISAAIARVDGKPLPKDKVEADERKELGNLSESLRATVKWTWGGERQKTIAPTPTVEVRSQRFKLESVPFWSWQTRNYLTKMERYHRVEQQATGRPGPASINLDWRFNTHNAKAIVGGAKGGGQWLWVSLPFRGYESNHDPWSEPWFVGHEMLHTFGYHHGDEMSRLQKLVEANFADAKWRMVDEPTSELPIEQAAVMPKPAKK